MVKMLRFSTLRVVSVRKLNLDGTLRSQKLLSKIFLVIFKITKTKLNKTGTLKKTSVRQNKYCFCWCR
jgi:hypothetical protein